MLPWETVREQLTTSRNYWIISTRPDGKPHAAPVWGLWLDEAFYFSTDPKSRKGKNIVASPEIVMHLESGDDVVILEGRLEEVTDTDELNRFADAYEAKYEFRPDVTDPQWGIYYKLKARLAFAWREKDFPTSATRWVFE
jgi:nitroimidazol reductase NimA-like FMN-containing flavoprotein (pyridoxamine 5'-phosphate oxidase superfamily)